MRIGDLKYTGKTGYSVAVPHMGLFYKALRLLHVLNGVAPKNSPFTHTNSSRGEQSEIHITNKKKLPLGMFPAQGSIRHLAGRHYLLTFW